MAGISNDINYGWCYTDHKNGKYIRTEYRTDDYIKDEPYASSVKKMLKQMGLPAPNIGQVFRGTHHDLLFIDNHGVVVRIGPTDVDDLVYPSIIQPLGWLDDQENNISVAIYPGIELSSTLKNSKLKGDGIDALIHSLNQNRQKSNDIKDHNTGIVRIEKDGREIPISILLDPDNKFNGTNLSTEKGQILKKIRESARKSIEGNTGSRVIEKAITTISDLPYDMKDYGKVFMMHQPLRNLFWLSQKNALDGGESDPYYMKRFWDECRQLKEKPKNYIVHKYSNYVNENGITIWKYDRELIKNAALYSPWTGNKNDQTPKRLIADHKQKILDEVEKDPEKIKGVHELFLRKDSFVRFLIEANPECYFHLPDNIINSSNFATTAYAVDKSLLSRFSDEALDDRELQYMIIYDARTEIDKEKYINSLPDYYRNNKELALKFMERTGRIYFNIIMDGDEWNNNKEYINRLIHHDEAVLADISEDLEMDRDFLWGCIKLNPKCLRYINKQASQALLTDIPEKERNNISLFKNIINSFIFEKSTTYLEHASDTVLFSDDIRETILVALLYGEDFYSMLPDRLKNNKKFNLACISSNKDLFYKMDVAIRNDYEIAEKFFHSSLSEDLDSFVFFISDENIYNILENNNTADVRKYIQEIICNNSKFYLKLPDEWKQDQEYSLSLLDDNTDIYKYFPDEIKSSKGIAVKAILQTFKDGANILEFVPDNIIADLKSDHKFLLDYAVAAGGNVRAMFFNQDLKKDKSFLDDIIKRNSYLADDYIFKAIYEQTQKEIELGDLADFNKWNDDALDSAYLIDMKNIKEPNRAGLADEFTEVITFFDDGLLLDIKLKNNVSRNLKGSFNAEDLVINRIKNSPKFKL